MVEWAVQNTIDYVVVAPDDPLPWAWWTRWQKKGIPAFGPNKAAARIEASKVFSKNLMKKYGIPTARYETFSDAESARAYIRTQDKYPVVVKADSLALERVCLFAKMRRPPWPL